MKRSRIAAAALVVNNRGPRQNGRRQPAELYDPLLEREAAAIDDEEGPGESTADIRLRRRSQSSHDVAKRLRAKIVMVDNLHEADVFVTLKSYYRKKRRLINNAEQQRTPIYVLRANSTNQMERFLAEVMDLKPEQTDPFEDADSRSK